MRKDVREFIRRLEAVGLTVESTPGHYRVMRDGKPLRKANGMPFMAVLSGHDPLAESGDRGTPQAGDRRLGGRGFAASNP
jgi:biotin operon repressor